MISRRGFLAVMGATVPLLSAGIGHAEEQPSPRAVLFDKDAPVIGNPDGDVTVVVYFDYQCSYCKRDYPMLRKAISDDGNTRLVMKDWPIFGPVSAYAAQCVLGAAQLGQYEAGLDALMRATGRLEMTTVDTILTNAGLDMDALSTAVKRNSRKINGLLDRNYLQADAFGFIGTPSYIVDKTLFPGVIGADVLSAAIAEARAT
ncbi:DsbA family protein [Martelella alba]|uniref:DsbA family protein n=1 Tax=Martelella alba TaxID=2590451 RepID=A0A506U6D4_9HYPH|nr:DsbA family protein [Martelella alba]TPW29058.1 DsbA family protein [Martelella alba]